MSYHTDQREIATFRDTRRSDTAGACSHRFKPASLPQKSLLQRRSTRFLSKLTTVFTSALVSKFAAVIRVRVNPFFRET
jgi:hypothetical protein